MVGEQIKGMQGQINGWQFSQGLCTSVLPVTPVVQREILKSWGGSLLCLLIISAFPAPRTSNSTAHISLSMPRLTLSVILSYLLFRMPRDPSRHLFTATLCKWTWQKTDLCHFSGYSQWVINDENTYHLSKSSLSYSWLLYPLLPRCMDRADYFLSQCSQNPLKSINLKVLLQVLVTTWQGGKFDGKHCSTLHWLFKMDLSWLVNIHQVSDTSETMNQVVSLYSYGTYNLMFSMGTSMS